jgi:hypothetical protein
MLLRSRELNLNAINEKYGVSLTVDNVKNSPEIGTEHDVKIGVNYDI